MPLLDKYTREDMLGDLDEATAQFEWRMPVETWICDCGCDNASWCQRVSGGLAYYMQAWPHGTAPRVMIFESREDVEVLLAGMATTPLATNQPRFTSFCAWMRACWDSRVEA
jgi:hypothetical protein